MAVTKEDIVSSGKDKRVYAKKGDVVTVVIATKNVIIVENNQGLRFSVTADQIE